ncbi:ferric reduction oxidase 8, mitochondrial isoform X1 [Typha angustifolia]|uniref:ferric reduction oxidase 8, mitochondrial isoform X1 n=1 Tax=Typha angustifolia TaxID=59011 RepID=UPI003C2FEB55
MAPSSIIAHVLKLSMLLLLAAWVCIWVLKPTHLWKRSWHLAEDWAATTFLGDYGINVVVFCFPILAVATLGYIYLDLCEKLGKLRRMRTSMPSSFSNPIIVSSSIGIVSFGELLTAALLIVFLIWTYYWNVASDFKKMTPYASLRLNRWQLRMMHMGVRIGSLSEVCLALLLLPILRGMAVFRILGVQFESAVRYHIWIGNGLALFAALHGISIMFIWVVKKSFLKELMKWPKTGRVNIAGAAALATLFAIWITSLPWMRRRKFQTFFLAHHLYILFILFFLLHAGDQHFYLVFSGVLLFSLDKILRIIQSRKEKCLISARILPCKAVQLTLPKHPSMKYTPTSMIFMKIPSISNLQWHPFTITSSCNRDDDRLSVIVKCQGQWTEALYSKVQSGQVMNLSVAIDGPYGPIDFPHRRYSNLVLVAGGSGITPFLSILHDIASMRGNTKRCTKILLIYSVKRIQDLSMLTPITPLLLNQPGELENLKLRIFITQEEGSASEAYAILHDMSNVTTVAMDRKSQGDPLVREDGLLWRAIITGLSFLIFLASLVFLSHIVLHHGKKSSRRKTPSWINDILLAGSFVISTSCCTLATVLSIWKQSPEGTREVHQKFAKDNEPQQTKALKSSFEGHEINFGKRPKIAELLSDSSIGTGESQVGVFVCGPYSMQESVASFCRTYSCNLKDAERQKSAFIYHSFNFSL